MSLDFPAFASALGAFWQRTGIRPEYVLPVFALESGYDPSIVNSIGCTGIDQNCSPPAGYESWSASQQLTGSITPRYQNIVSTFGPIGSATRAYQANLLPSTLATATSMDSVIAERGSSRPVPRGGGLTEGAVYAANPGLDANGDGYITVSDLAAKMQQMLSRSSVQSAIAQTYAVLGGSPDSDPALGTDFGGSGSAAKNVAILVGILGLGGALAYLASRPAVRRRLAFG